MVLFCLVSFFVWFIVMSLAVTASDKHAYGPCLKSLKRKRNATLLAVRVQSTAADQKLVHSARHYERFYQWSLVAPART